MSTNFMDYKNRDRILYRTTMGTVTLLKPVMDELTKRGFIAADTKWKGSLRTYFRRVFLRRKKVYRIEVIASTALWTIQILELKQPVIHITDTRLP